MNRTPGLTFFCMKVTAISLMYSNQEPFTPQGFSKNGRLTIATVDPRNQELIGRRNGLSHRDTHLANLMYGCIG